MSLKPLLSHVKKIVTSKIKTLYKIRRHLDNHNALAVYKQMILPLFDYSVFVLLSCNKTDREDLQTIQNNTLRHCLGLRLNDRVSLSDIHLQANLLSLEQRRCIQLLSLLFMHGKCHEYLRYRQGILEQQIYLDIELRYTRTPNTRTVPIIKLLNSGTLCPM